jgi:methylated-DNA-[protein]-cysteine S-methyltransferase
MQSRTDNAVMFSANPVAPIAPRTALTLDTPLGSMWIAQEGDAITGIYFAGQQYEADRARYIELTSPTQTLHQAASQLAEYFAGQRKQFDLPLAMNGTSFQTKVWRGLQAIPYGQTVSYAQLARQLGLEAQASRAVGAANGKNPFTIVVPCHRVIASSGALTGYAGGVERKAWLLRHEMNE